MKSVATLRDEIRNLTARVEAVVELATAEAREINTDEQAIVDEVAAQKPVVEKQLENALKIEAIVASKMHSQLENRRNENLALTPVRVKSAFRKGGIFATAEEQYDAGQFFAAAIFGNTKATQYCQENGISLRQSSLDVQNTMSTSDNTKGGFLVPEPLEATIIELREQYGIFAADAQPWSMASGVDQVPKLTGEVTTYYVGEGTAPTASDVALGLVRLEAKKLATLSAVNNELNEDSILSVAEMLSRSIAQQMSYAEDNAGFNGDGTSTYGGIVGLKSALLAGSVHDALAGNVGFTTFDLADFEAVVGKLKMYAGIMPKWYISQTGWANSMQRLMDAAGGTGGFDIAAGMPRNFLGYPVRIAQACPQASAVSTILAYFGDLRMGAILGRRRGLTVKADASFYFTSDQLAILATQRYDINVHDVGTASAAGSIIALKTPAS